MKIDLYCYHCFYKSGSYILFSVLQERFKTGLLAQSEEFKKQVHNLVDEFTTKGPFTSNISTEEAVSNIQAIRDQLNTLKKQEQDIRKGLNIFKIDQPPSKEVANLEKVRLYIQTCAIHVNLHFAYR